MFNSTVNVGANGIRMGVISLQSIDPDIAQELWYGPGATDLSYQAAYKEAKAQAESEWAQAYEEAEVAAAETDYHMSDEERDSFIEKWFDENEIHFDRDDFVEQKLEWFSDCYMCDEPQIEGEYRGVKYLIGWLGGAPLLWVTEGPVGLANRLCSPCVPNAADLDGGFVLDSEVPEDEIPDSGFECYCVPREWLFKDQA